MQDILIIPTYDRPEMLWLCLEFLAASPESNSVQVRVVVDAHVNQPPPPRTEILEVLEKFPQLSLQVGFRPSHQFPGNSFNVLMAYRDAYETEAELIFMVEDDVLISPDFFDWHRCHHAITPLACTIGVQNPGHGAYASLGVCFRREFFRLLLPHCRAAYFQNMRNYCRSYFPASPFDCEQDGLLARLLKDYPVLWAKTPKAQHVGWYGYHRKKSIRPTGTLEQRFEQVKATLRSEVALSSLMKDFGDIRTLPPCN